MRRLAILAISITSLFLTACSGKADIWLYAGQRWRVTGEVMFDPATLPKIDQSGNAILPGVTLDSIAQSVALGALDNNLEESAKQLRTQNIQAAWQHTTRGKDVVYTLDLTGQGWDKLKQVMAGGPTFLNQLPQAGSLEIKDAGSGQLAFVAQMLPGGFSVQVPADVVIKLHAAKIVSGNPNRIEGGNDVAVWQGLQTNMSAIVDPLAQSPLDSASPVGLILGVVIALAIVVLITFLILSNRGGGQLGARRVAPRPYQAKSARKRPTRR